MATTGQSGIRITKAARLVILLELHDHYLLKGRTLEQIAQVFGVGHRSTILRDLRELPALRREIERMRERVLQADLD